MAEQRGLGGAHDSTGAELDGERTQLLGHDGRKKAAALSMDRLVAPGARQVEIDIGTKRFGDVVLGCLNEYMAKQAANSPTISFDSFRGFAGSLGAWISHQYSRSMGDFQPQTIPESDNRYARYGEDLLPASIAAQFERDPKMANAVIAAAESKMQQSGWRQARGTTDFENWTRTWE